jgi:hypothetical protein
MNFRGSRGSDGRVETSIDVGGDPIEGEPAPRAPRTGEQPTTKYTGTEPR